MIEEMALAYLLLPPRKFNLKITSVMLMHNVAKSFLKFQLVLYVSEGYYKIFGRINIWKF